MLRDVREAPVVNVWSSGWSSSEPTPRDDDAATEKSRTGADGTPLMPDSRCRR